MQEIILCLTRKCNLDCSHCYSDCGSSYPLQSLNEQEIPSFIQRVALLAKKTRESSPDPSFLSVNLSGGEVLLLGLPYMRKVVNAAKKAVSNCLGDMSCFFSVTTNLTLIDEEYLSYFRDENVLLSTSFDPDIRSLGGSHARFLKVWKEKLEICQLQGINPRVCFCVTRQLAHSLSGFCLLDFCIENGITDANIELLQLSGRAKKNAPDVSLSARETSNYIISLLEKKKGDSKYAGINIDPFDDMPEIYKHFMSTGMGGCDCWNECYKSLCVYGDGVVSAPCGHSVYGNLRTDSDRDLIASAGRIRYIGIKSGMSMFNDGFHSMVCPNCKHSAFCRGGCVACQDLPVVSGQPRECRGLKAVLDYVTGNYKTCKILHSQKGGIS